MDYYPVNIDLKGKKCLVVGGGDVGTRKVKTLLKCGAKVSVAAVDITRELELIVEKWDAEFFKGTYNEDVMKDVFLVVGATNNEEVNRKISKDAREKKALCNIADRPEISDFIVPSIVSRGDLTISVSTGGKSPAYAKRLRRELEKQFGYHHAVFLKLMGEIRKKVLCSESERGEKNKDLFETLANSPIIDLIKENKIEDINSILVEILGPGYEFQKLMVP